MTQIQLKRVYADASGSDSEDGFRIYIDRLWPRGESKAQFRYDLWAKDAAPSTALREWYHADRTGRRVEFARRYMAELETNPAAKALAEEAGRHALVTLLYSSREGEATNASVLAEYLRGRIGGKN